MLAATLFLTVAVMFLDRAAISLLIVSPAFLAELGIQGDPTAQGLLMTVFLTVYAAGNLALGPLGDRLGARRMMSYAIVGWGLASTLMGLATTYPLMLLGRALRGVGEGPTFPMMTRYVRNWFRPEERGRANTIWLVGHHVGPALALPLAFAVMNAYGWRSVLFLQALVCFGLLLPLLVFLTADRPSESPRVGTAEVLHIEQPQLGEHVERLPWLVSVRLFAAKAEYWLAVGFHTFQLALFAGFMTWLPKYLAEARGFDLRGAALWGALPYVVGGVAMLLFVAVSDRVGRPALFCALVNLATALLVLLAAYVSWNEASAVLLAFALASWSLASPLYYAMLQRIAPAQAMGAASGLDNGLANTGAAFAPALIGYLIAVTGTYFAGLVTLAVCGAAAMGFMLLLAWRGY